MHVASFAEAWIEKELNYKAYTEILVASFAEAWIENLLSTFSKQHLRLSPPSRRRGLKTAFVPPGRVLLIVASFAEAWIEKWRYTMITERLLQVASFAEAWIENIFAFNRLIVNRVASFAEAWIEKLRGYGCI